MLINVMPIRKHVFFSLPFFLLVSSTELRLQVTFVAICSRGIWGNFIFIIAAAKLLKELAIMKEKTGNFNSIFSQIFVKNICPKLYEIPILRLKLDVQYSVVQEF